MIAHLSLRFDDITVRLLKTSRFFEPDFGVCRFVEGCEREWQVQPFVVEPDSDEDDPGIYDLLGSLIKNEVEDVEANDSQDTASSDANDVVRYLEELLAEHVQLESSSLLDDVRSCLAEEGDIF